MNAPLVSVVIPAYNAARTLKATVQSVFEQTVQDFEIVIVDDGSTDDTIAVARSIEDSRVKVITQANGGAAAARNTGIKSAKGKYVAMLDADDLWMPNKLERQLAVFNSEKDVSAVQSGVYYVNDNLEVISVERCVESKDILYETLVFENLPGLMSTLIVKRTAFEEIGYLDTKLVILEDWELAIRLARYCNFASIEEPLTLYRQFPGNRSRNVSIHIEPGYIILDRLFKDPSLPSHIKKREKQIYAAFYTMLCGGAFRRGRYGESLKWGAKAFTSYPAALYYITSLPSRKLHRKFSRQNMPQEYKLALKNFSNLHTLYLCYFGLREPLVQTQVLPYLREIKKLGNLKVSLLTFEPNFKEKWTAEQLEAEKRELAGEDINWYCLPYHKRPSVPVTLYDILCGAWFTWKMIQREKVDILHARVHIPAIMGAVAKRFSFDRKPKLLFDIRGFFPEEYTDAGIWKKNGWIYRGVKRIEKWLLRESDGFVVLTEKAREILFPESREKGFDKFGRPVEVIPCCVNLARFESANDVSRNKVRKNLNIEDRKVIVYVGSFGGWYLTKETADFFGAAKEKYPNVFALILTQSPTKLIKPLLENRGFNAEDFLITQVLPKEIPLYLGASDVAVSFIKSCYSKQASSPTKNAEYLACGLPVIVNTGVGDTAEITVEDKTGVIIEEFNRENYRKAFVELEKLLENKKSLTERCRESAEARFDLQSVGGARYQKLYRRLLEKD
ncbi:MAG: glycosyltransferase [Acidobacteria bacterium]|nr:glycosyltransferase [Acidobacteriota bacterium]